MRKIALVVIPLLLVLHLFFAYHYLFMEPDMYFNAFGSIFRSAFLLFSVSTMFGFGIFRKTKLVIGAYIGMVAIIIGIVFTLMHWPGGKMLFTSGWIIVGVFYLLHFITKESKQLLDWLKIGYVIIGATGYPVLLNHLLPYELLVVVTWIILIAAIVVITVFYISILKPKPKAIPVISDEDQDVFRYVD